LVDGSVIAGLDADQQLLGHDRGRGLGEDLFEYIRERSCIRSRRRVKLGQSDRSVVGLASAGSFVGSGFFSGH
jgi:hypothetical protein